MTKASRLMIAFVFALLLVSSMGGTAVSATLQSTAYKAQSVNLNPEGEAYEVNRDHEGKLWVSDCGAGEIRMYDPNLNDSNIITFYDEPSICPSDARRDLANNVWFVDTNAGDRIGRLNGSNWAEVNFWQIPMIVGSEAHSYNLWGTTFDHYGNFWITDASAPYVYRFYYQPGDTNNFCEYRIPDLNGGNTPGSSYYTIALDDKIWLADYTNNDLLRLNPGGNPPYFERWDIPDEEGTNGYPTWMAADVFGNIWWVDSSNEILGRLIPEDNYVTFFHLPSLTTPQGISILSQEVWYTELYAPAVGVLNPLDAETDESDSFNVTHTTNLESPEQFCRTLNTGSGETNVAVSGPIPWEDETYTEILMPNSSWSSWKVNDSASPWGIADAGEWAYFIQQGTHKFSRITTKTIKTFLPVTIRQ